MAKKTLHVLTLDNRGEEFPEDAGREVIWQVVARRSTYKKLSSSDLYRVRRKIDEAAAQVSAKV